MLGRHAVLTQAGCLAIFQEAIQGFFQVYQDSRVARQPARFAPLGLAGNGETKFVKNSAFQLYSAVRDIYFRQDHHSKTEGDTYLMARTVCSIQLLLRIQQRLIHTRALRTSRDLICQQNGRINIAALLLSVFYEEALLRQGLPLFEGGRKR